MARTAKVNNKEVSKEVSAAIKSLRHSSEVESFYRFIHENNLRAEAKILMETVLATIKPARKSRSKAKKLQ